MKGTKVRLIQLEDHSVSQVFYKPATESDLANFIQAGLANVQLRSFDTQAFLESLGNTVKRTLILSSFDFTAADNVNVTFVDFSRTTKTSTTRSNYFSVAHFLEDSSDIESLFFQIRYKVVEFVDPDTFVITKPYGDFTGDGEIVTMGFPVKRSYKYAYDNSFYTKKL